MRCVRTGGRVQGVVSARVRVRVRGACACVRVVCVWCVRENGGAAKLEENVVGTEVLVCMSAQYVFFFGLG